MLIKFVTCYGCTKTKCYEMISNPQQILTDWNRWTLCEGISSEAIITCTDRDMVDHMAVSISPTRPRTGISTTLLDASHLTRAFSTQNTFRTACRRSSDVIWQTWAGWVSSNHLTLRIRTTGRWQAWWSWRGGWSHRLRFCKQFIIKTNIPFGVFELKLTILTIIII